jgi:hypothetical protein
MMDVKAGDYAHIRVGVVSVNSEYVIVAHSAFTGRMAILHSDIVHVEESVGVGDRVLVPSGSTAKIVYISGDQAALEMEADVRLCICHLEKLRRA